MVFKYTYKYFFLVLFLLISAAVTAQVTVVSGKITDGGNKDGLPFVSVSFVGTTIGVTTNGQGYYKLTSTQPQTKIKVSFFLFFFWRL